MTPTLKVRFRDEDFAVTPYDDGPSWCVHVAGACYFVGDDALTAETNAGRLLRQQLRNNPSRAPGLIARRRNPILLSIDGVTVRAWPELMLRGSGAKTYVNPASGDRVATTRRWPSWIFQTTAKPASPFGTVTSEQTIEDVADLAKVWLRG